MDLDAEWREEFLKLDDIARCARQDLEEFFARQDVWQDYKPLIAIFEETDKG